MVEMEVLPLLRLKGSVTEEGPAEPERCKHQGRPRPTHSPRWGEAGHRPTCHGAPARGGLWGRTVGMGCPRGRQERSRRGRQVRTPRTNRAPARPLSAGGGAGWRSSSMRKTRIPEPGGHGATAPGGSAWGGPGSAGAALTRRTGQREVTLSEQNVDSFQHPPPCASSARSGRLRDGHGDGHGPAAVVFLCAGARSRSCLEPMRTAPRFQDNGGRCRRPRTCSPPRRPGGHSQVGKWPPGQGALDLLLWAQPRSCLQRPAG